MKSLRRLIREMDDLSSPQIYRGPVLEIGPGPNKTTWHEDLPDEILDVIIPHLMKAGDTVRGNILIQSALQEGHGLYQVKHTLIPNRWTDLNGDLGESVPVIECKCVVDLVDISSSTGTRRLNASTTNFLGGYHIDMRQTVESTIKYSLSKIRRAILDLS